MDGNIYALDFEGNLEWTHEVGSSIVASPVLVPRGLVVVNKKGKLSLLDVSPNAGPQRELFSITLGDAEVKAPLYVVGESVYVGSQDSTIRRVEVKGGPVVLWCRHTKEGRCS
jgi:outer membrane protein assembly factor BamB